MGVRFVVIGVAGANYYAIGGATMFVTEDRDLFLPPDVEAVLRSWQACEERRLELRVGTEPLDVPRDRDLAGRIVERRATIRATDNQGLDIDLTLTMSGFDFETVWRERRTFSIDGIDVPVARLTHIVASKHAAGRDKDRLFLATYREALEQLVRRDE